MRVLVAMSGGVDSSVAAALLSQEGHQVVGATMKLWGGPSDSGCCTVADVEDARSVADRLGITHHVFNFSADFTNHVVEPYIDAHLSGFTPNPCIECNRHLKFSRLIDRASKLGFDAVATGHHARIDTEDGRWRLLRGVDRAKDQSYVVSMLSQDQLSKSLFPIGWFDKTEIRRLAGELGLRTATKRDSQDVCFISRAGPRPNGRGAFLAERTELRSGVVVEAATGEVIGRVPAVELVTVGQRRGLGVNRGSHRRFALAVDPARSLVYVGSEEDLATTRIPLESMSWVDEMVPRGKEVLVQSSAHGHATAAIFDGSGVVLHVPRRRVAPGQTVVLYRGDQVLGSGVARR